jgi:flagellin
MTVINTNVRALMVRNAMQTNDRSLTDAMQQLSTGKRINSAKDDAAGLAISTRMTQQIQSLAQAVRNAGDAISLVQTAEGATQQVTDALQRMRELSIEAINDTYGNDQRGYLDLEFQQLKQEIVQIANNTEWNGFPILNGTAGQAVGTPLVQRISANGQFSTAAVKAGVVSFTPTAAVTAPTLTAVVNGMVTKTGPMVITITATGTAGALEASLNGGAKVAITGATGSQTVTFPVGGTSLNPQGNGTITITPSIDFVAGSGTFNLDSKLDYMNAGDASINGTTIDRPPLTFFNPNDLDSNPAASALAKVAAINAKSTDTGVTAVVNTNVMTGSAMSVSPSPHSGFVVVNGFKIPLSTLANNAQGSRAAVVAAINAPNAFESTGVVAIDSGNDAAGVVLQAKDGRNIQVVFQRDAGSADDAAFAAVTGLKQGVQTGGYSLSASGQKPITIVTKPGGDIKRSGLQDGVFKADTSVAATLARQSRECSAAGYVAPGLKSGDLLINGVEIPPSTSQVAPSASNYRYLDESSAVAIAAAINTRTEQTKVIATPTPASVRGEFSLTSTKNWSGDLYISGLKIPNVDLTNSTSIISAINTNFLVTGVKALENPDGNGIELQSDGRSFSVQYGAVKNATGATQTTAPTGMGMEAYFGLSGSNATLYATTGNVENLNYGGVSLATTVSIETQAVTTPVPGERAPKVLPAQIIVAAGVNGFNDSSNFTGLGFADGVYGGESGLDATSPRVGRLSFQIGASAGQTIHIDLGDFGSKGPITGKITADVDDPNHPVNISTSAGAQNVLSILDGAMDSVNATRASMGAIMNRMQQVITNLSNVGTNASASRSQVEDADYAKASSDMARAQIIAQAATAVLAQANTSQQTVLKLLQG